MNKIILISATVLSLVIIYAWITDSIEQKKIKKIIEDLKTNQKKDVDSTKGLNEQDFYS